MVYAAWMNVHIIKTMHHCLSTHRIKLRNIYSLTWPCSQYWTQWTQTNRIYTVFFYFAVQDLILHSFQESTQINAKNKHMFWHNVSRKWRQIIAMLNTSQVFAKNNFGIEWHTTPDILTVDWSVNRKFCCQIKSQKTEKWQLNYRKMNVFVYFLLWWPFWS